MPWIFASCSPVRAPLLLLPIPGAPLVLLCSTEGRSGVGTHALSYGAQGEREGQEEKLPVARKQKGRETLSKTGRESDVRTSALDSV